MLLLTNVDIKITAQIFDFIYQSLTQEIKIHKWHLSFLAQ